MPYNPVDPRGRIGRLAYLPYLAAVNLSMYGVQSIRVDTAAMKMATVLTTMLIVWMLYCAWAKRLRDIGYDGTMAAVAVATLGVAGIILNTQTDALLGYAAVGMISLLMMFGGFLALAPGGFGNAVHEAGKRTGSGAAEADAGDADLMMNARDEKR